MKNSSRIQAFRIVTYSSGKFQPSLSIYPPSPPLSLQYSSRQSSQITLFHTANLFIFRAKTICLSRKLSARLERTVTASGRSFGNFCCLWYALAPPLPIYKLPLSLSIIQFLIFDLLSTLLFQNLFNIL